MNVEWIRCVLRLSNWPSECDSPTRALPPAREDLLYYLLMVHFNATMQIEENVIQTILHAHGGHMERTVEALLTLAPQEEASNASLPGTEAARVFGDAVRMNVFEREREAGTSDGLGAFVSASGVTEDNLSGFSSQVRPLRYECSTSLVASTANCKICECMHIAKIFLNEH